MIAVTLALALISVTAAAPDAYAAFNLQYSNHTAQSNGQRSRLAYLTLVTAGMSDSGAVCLDGSPPGYYFREGHGEGTTKWIVEVKCKSCVACTCGSVLQCRDALSLNPFTALLARPFAPTPSSRVMCITAGGWCHDEASCESRAGGEWGTTVRAVPRPLIPVTVPALCEFFRCLLQTVHPQSVFLYGILSADPEVNPDFHSWNVITLL